MTSEECIEAIRERTIQFDPDSWDAVQVRSLAFDLDEILDEYDRSMSQDQNSEPEPDDGSKGDTNR